MRWIAGLKCRKRGEASFYKLLSTGFESVNLTIIIRSCMTIGVQLVRLVSFILLLRALDSEKFQFFLSELSFLSVALIVTAGVPLYVKNLALSNEIDMRGLRVILACCFSITTSICLVLLFTYTSKYGYLVFIVTLLFLFRLLASYVEIVMNVSHNYVRSLSLSLIVEVVFLCAVIYLPLWELLSAIPLQQVAFIMAIIFFGVSICLVIVTINEYQVVIRRRYQLWRFSAIEIGSVIVFGLDLYFASKFFDSSRFAIYALVMRLFSPVGQFQGIVTRHYWSAGYNKDIDKAKLFAQNRQMTQFSLVMLLVVAGLSLPLLNSLNYEVQIERELHLFIFMLIVYSIIIILRHYKNILNANGITHEIWRIYLVSSLVFIVLVFIASLTGVSGEFYLLLRVLFFSVIVAYLFNFLRTEGVA